MSDKNINRVKNRVIMLMSIALTAFVLVVFLVFNSYNKLLDAMDVLSEPNTKVRQLNELLTDLSLAENKLRSYVVTKRGADYEVFQKAVSDIESKIDSLALSQSTSALYFQYADSLEALLQLQVNILKDYVKLSPHNPSIYMDKALSELESHALDSSLSTTYSQITSSTRQVTDSILLLPKKNDEAKAKGLLNKIKSLFTKPTPKADTIQNVNNQSTTVRDTTTLVKYDSAIINAVKDILTEIREEEQLNLQERQARELILVQRNTEVIDNIKKIITRLEKQEQYRSNLEKSSAKKLVDENLWIINGIIICMGVLCLVIFFLIFSDISKSNFYKNRLETARRKAENLARIKEQFLANMSHEIRTPLNAVIGYTAQLGKTRLNKDQKKSVNILKSTSNHLLSIVNDILDLSKIESGELKLLYESFDIYQLLKDAYNTFLIRAEEKGIALNFKTNEQAGLWAKGDAGRLKQVFYNLIDNAIKFTDEGHVSIVLIANEAGSNLLIDIEIQDSGIGIPEDQQKNVFKDFYQSDSTSKRKFQGTGLGLSICKKIVEMHGGNIAINSAVGEGSTFSVHLNLEKSEAQVIAQKETVSEKTLEHTNIMVVDDDKFNLSLIEQILKEHNAQVYTTSSANEAFKRLQNKNCDLVLTDIQMPEMDGVELIENIKKIKPALPVLAFTANVTKKFDKYGFAATVTKPVSETDLIETIYGVLHDGDIQNKKEPDGEIISEDHSEGQLYNLNDILVFSQNDPQSAAEMLTVFMDSYEQDLEQLNQYNATKNIDEVSERAHKMRSPCGQLKMNMIMKILGRLEAKEWKDQAERNKMVDELNKQSKIALSALKKETIEFQSRSEIINTGE